VTGSVRSVCSQGALSELRHDAMAIGRHRVDDWNM
jgi:hypothetical protein